MYFFLSVPLLFHTPVKIKMLVEKKGETIQMKISIKVLFCIFFEFFFFFQSVYEILILSLQYVLLTTHSFFETESTLSYKKMEIKYLFAGTLYSWQKQL